MNVNIITQLEDTQSTKDYLNTITDPHKLVTINSSIDFHDHDVSLITNILTDLRFSPLNRAMDTLSVQLSKIAKGILDDSTFSIDKYTVDFNSEFFSNLNTYMYSKGYFPVVSKSTDINNPDAYSSDHFLTKVPFSENLEQNEFFTNTLNHIFSFETLTYEIYSSGRNYISAIRNEILASESYNFDIIKSIIVELINKTLGFQAVNITFQKLNKLDFPSLQNQVYSSWSQQFLGLFDLNKIHRLPLEEDTSCSLHHVSHKFKHTFPSRSWSETCAFLNQYSSIRNSSMLKIGSMSSITLLDDSWYTSDSANNFCSKVKALILNSTQSKIQGFSLSSYKRVQPDKEFFEVISTYTKKQSLRRNGFFIPLLVPIKILTENLDESTVYYLTFVLIDKLETLMKKKTSKEALTTFSANYSCQEGLYYYDNDKYFDSFKDNFGPNAFKYSNEFLDLVKSLTPQEIDRMKSLNTNYKPSYPPLSSEMNNLLTSQPLIDLKKEKIFNKFKQKFENIKEKKRGFKNEIFTTLNRSRSNVYSILEKKKRIADLQDRIKKLEKLINEEASFIVKNVDNYEKYTSAYWTNKTKFDHAKLDYNKALNDSILKNNFSSDGFFDSLAKDGIKLLNLVYRNGYSNKTETINATTSFSKCTPVQINQFSKDPAWALDTFEFLIDRPVKILVDGNPNKFVYGGPYIVRVTQHRLEIKLAYSNSLFGYDPSRNNFYVHPHSSRPNFAYLFDPDRFYNACLGEAAPLLYNAFQKKDLKLAILSAMTWVSSANSSDTWGKHYKYFIGSINDITEPILSSQESITPSEVQEFIENVTDEEEPSHPESELPDNLNLEDTNAPVPFDAPLRDLVNNIETHELANPTPVPAPAEPQPEPTQTYVRYTNP